MKVWIVVQYVPFDKDKILSVHVTERGAKLFAHVHELQGIAVDVSEWETFQ